MCRFKPSQTLREGSCECTFFVAKKFAFKQFRWNGRAIEFDQRAISSRTILVHSLRDQFFSRSRFTFYQNTRVGCGDGFDETKGFHQGWAVTDDSGKAILRGSSAVICVRTRDWVVIL